MTWMDDKAMPGSAINENTATYRLQSFHFACLFYNQKIEGRGLPELGAGIHSRDRVPCLSPLLKDQADHAHAPDQAVHVPALQKFGLHPCPRHMPSWYQTSESSFEPRYWNFEVVRFRKVSKQTTKKRASLMRAQDTFFFFCAFEPHDPGWDSKAGKHKGIGKRKKRGGLGKAQGEDKQGQHGKDWCGTKHKAGKDRKEMCVLLQLLRNQKKKTSKTWIFFFT